MLLLENVEFTEIGEIFYFPSLKLGKGKFGEIFYGVNKDKTVELIIKKEIASSELN